MAFAGQVCFVAGGCGTVGTGIVRSFLQEDARVVVNSRAAVRLDELRSGLPPDLQSNLTTIQEDCGTQAGVQNIKNFVMKECGKVDHVVTSLGSFWQKGVLTEQSLGEFQEEVHNGAGTHFLVTKAFLPYLSDRGGSTFTYITGGAGEHCFDPTVSLLTVKAACLFGVAEAARAQCKNSPLAVNEIRIAVYVQPADDAMFKSQDTVVGSDFMGRVCTSIIRRKPRGIVRIESRGKMNELLQL